MTIKQFKTSKKALTSAILGLSFSTMSAEANSADIMKDHYHPVMTQDDIQDFIEENEEKEKGLTSQNRYPSTHDSEKNRIKEILKIKIINRLKNETIEKSKIFKINFEGYGSYCKQEITLICNGIEDYANYPQINHHFTTTLNQKKGGLNLSKITFGKSIPLRFENGMYVKKNSLYNEMVFFDCTLEISAA